MTYRYNMCSTWKLETCGDVWIIGACRGNKFDFDAESHPVGTDRGLPGIPKVRLFTWVATDSGETVILKMSSYQETS